MEIASGSIMRGFMSVPCDPYFTVGAKIRRFDCSLKLYDVPQAKRECIIGKRFFAWDLHSMAEGIIQKTIQQAEAGFESAHSRNRERPAEDSSAKASSDMTTFVIHEKGSPMKKKTPTMLPAIDTIALLRGAAHAATPRRLRWRHRFELPAGGESGRRPALASGRRGACRWRITLVRRAWQLLMRKLTNEIVLNGFVRS